MQNNPPASPIRHGTLLGGTALLAALVLGLINLLTTDRIIAQQQVAERNALSEVLPSEFHDNDLLRDAVLLDPQSPDYAALDLLSLTEAKRAYIARKGQEFTGIILPSTVHNGYSGDIEMLVGILANGEVSGVRVLSHSETPGLGDKIDIRIADWILTFNGRTLENTAPSQWRVVKEGGEFDQFVGATVTPRAVIGGVYRVLEFYSLNKENLAELK